MTWDEGGHEYEYIPHCNKITYAQLFQHQDALGEKYTIKFTETEILL